MPIYFESNFDPNIDLFVWFIPYILVLFIFYKVPFLLSIFSDLLSVSSRQLLISYAIFMLLIFLLQLTNYLEVAGYKSKVERSKFRTTEGCIYNFSVTETRSRTESFTLNNVTFSYSAVGTGQLFFANRQFEDGVIHEGRCLRVSYFTKGRTNKIFKVQLLD